MTLGRCALSIFCSRVTPPRNPLSQPALSLSHPCSGADMMHNRSAALMAHKNKQSSYLNDTVQSHTPHFLNTPGVDNPPNRGGQYVRILGRMPGAFVLHASVPVFSCHVQPL